MRAAKMRNIEIVGVQMHIGSQITEAEPFASAITKATPIVRDLKSKYGIKFFQQSAAAWESFTARPRERVRQMVAQPRSRIARIRIQRP